MRHTVTFKTTTDIKNFATDMNTFIPDVNIYYGHQVFDAKSILCLMSLQLYKSYEVELLADNKLTQDIFAKIVSKYGG